MRERDRGREMRDEGANREEGWTEGEKTVDAFHLFAPDLFGARISKLVHSIGAPRQHLPSRRDAHRVVWPAVYIDEVVATY